MKICPQCGFRDDPLWKPLFWRLYWEYMPIDDFIKKHPKIYDEIFGFFVVRPKGMFCKDGNFWYHAEDEFYYYRVGGKTRRFTYRFPKGFESMANRKLFEKTPSEVRK